MGVDILNFQSLKKANNLAKNSFEKEYVTVYIKNRPKKFKIKNIGLKKKLLSYRVVLDYAEDFNLISNMLKYFTKQRKDFSLKDIVKYIDRNPILKKINSQNLTKYGYL
jgi:spore coat polysaccharide biosynthesis protein SpsF (cytidylyltransferase family)